ncbi:Zinc finger CCCH domain-containing protein 48 [Ancistrocladus abbreviatus]
MDTEPNGNKRVFQRLGPTSNKFQNQPRNHHHNHKQQQQKVCYNWQAGRCNRFPCPYLHSELPGPSLDGTSSKRPHSLGGGSDEGFSMRKSPNFSNTWGRVGGSNQNNNGNRGGGAGGGGGVTVRKQERVCNYWVQGNCTFGDRCKFLHSWSVGESFSLLTMLEGHQKGVTGIAWPSGSDKLYTGGKDATVRVWDCQSGQCAGVVNLSGEVGCMISEGPWIFVGLPNMVKVWNAQMGTDLSLTGPIGQVYALVVGDDFLFAGTQMHTSLLIFILVMTKEHRLLLLQDGTILAWKFNAATSCFEPAASLKGHTLAVVTLVVGANRLYSGSMDHSIRVWNLETLQCMQTLTEHTSVVMSVLCWDQFLLSCSLDKTIKVWVATESGNLEVTYTHNEEHYSTLVLELMSNDMHLMNHLQGLLSLCGMHDSEAKPVLLCSSNDNSVRLYDLPSFLERGKIFAKQEIRSIQIGPGGLFFTGDGSGQVKIWKWST